MLAVLGTLKIIEHFEFLTRMLHAFCAGWACGSGTHAHAERARQVLMRALSIRVRNWCVHWAYASGTNVCTERSPFKTCWAKWAYASGTDAYPEHTGQELMRALSIRVRNWCARSTCASEIKWCLAPLKIKVTSLYFSPKVTNPERLYGAKIMKSERPKISDLGTFNRIMPNIIMYLFLRMVRDWICCLCSGFFCTLTGCKIANVCISSYLYTVQECFQNVCLFLRQVHATSETEQS